MIVGSFALATMLADPQIPVVPFKPYEPRKTANISQSDCEVWDEAGKQSRFTIASDNIWDRYSYFDADTKMNRTEYGSYFSLTGSGIFSGWSYEKLNKYIVLGNAFRNEKGEHLIYESGVAVPPQPYMRPKGANTDYNRGTLPKWTITLAIVSSDGQSADVFAGYCIRTKFEQVPARQGVRSIDK